MAGAFNERRTIVGFQIRKGLLHARLGQRPSLAVDSSGQHAGGAIEHEKDVHSFNGQKPLQSGDGEDDGEHDNGANNQCHPFAPGANLNITLESEPEHPRHRRYQQQQVDWILPYLYRYVDILE